MKKIKIIGLVLALSIVIGLFAACSGTSSGGISIGAKTIDLKDYITIDYGKYNGYSEPVFDVDRVSMSTVFDTEKIGKFKKTLPESVQFEFNYITSYAHFFDFDFAEDYNNISNGDKLIINVTLDSFLTDYGVTMEDFCKACGIKFKETTIEYTVSGLEDLPDMLDVFEGITQYAQYDGANGYGRCSGIRIPDDYMRQVGELYFVKADYNNSAVKVLLNNTKISEIAYSVEYNEKLSMGDTVILKASITTFDNTVVEDDIVFLSTYSCFKNSSVELIVPDLGKYLTTVEEFTPDVIEKIKAQIYEKHGVKNIEKMYFSTFLPGVESPASYKVPVFITVIVNDRRNFSFYDYFFIDYVENIMLTPAGEVVFGYDDVSYPYYGEVQGAVDDLDYDSFVYTELPLY